MAGHSQENSHKAIVIGAGLGGLAAAMRLGAKGYEVTLLDRLERAGGRGSSITQDGYRFDLGPTMVTVPHIYEQLWADCGRDFHADVTLKPMDPYYEIRWPDGSNFFVTGDTQLMETEVARLNPADVPGYRRFLEESRKRYVAAFEGLMFQPMHDLWETLKVLPAFAWLRADQPILKLAQKYVSDERLRMALSFHPLFIGGDPSRVTSMYALVSYLEKEYGVFYTMGGVQAIADAMVRVIEEQGGRVQLGVDVDEIIVEDGRAAGVRMGDGEILRAPIVVSNADAGHTYETLLRKHKVPGWTRANTKRRWSMSLFIWYFGTYGTREMWKDVGHHTILSGPRYKGLLDDIFIKGKLADDMSLYIHRPALSDPSAAPEGGDSFYVLSPVPHLGFDSPVDWSTEKAIYKRKMARVLGDIIPGFQDHIETEVVFTPETFRDMYLSPHGGGFSIEPRMLQSAWFRPHNVSPLAGLFLVGAGTHPGAGVPAVVASAEVMAQLVPDAPTPLAPNLFMAAE
ncbi:MAG: phytoene desaturase family protein [Pseudomonadota bacterium]